EKQRDAARANLKTGLAAIEAMLVRTGADTLRDAPGSKPLRRELLSTAVRFCEDFMARHGDEPSVRSEAARTRVLLASLMEGLGEYDRAEEEFIAAQKLLRLHLAENPKDLPGQSMLALADRHLARLKTTADPDDLAARVSQIDLSIAMIERLAEENPEDLGLRHSLALSIQAQAWIHQMRGDRETALVGQTRALEIIEDLLAWRPTLPAFRETMARALSNQGMFLVDLGRPAEAKGSLERSKRLFRDLLREKAPQNGWYSALSVTERNLARVYRTEGRKKEAEAEYDAAVRNSERLVRQDPDVPDYRTHLATALRFRARFLESENRSDEALRDFEQFRELMELALRTGEPNPQSRYEFARTLSAIGEAHLKKGRTAEAEKAFTRGRELLTALLTQSPGEPRFLAETAEAWRDLGRTAMRKEDFEEAERCMRRGLEVRRQAAAGAKPGSPEQVATLDQRLWLAHAIERSGKFGPAIDEYGGLSAESGDDDRLQGEIIWRLGTIAFHAKTTPDLRTRSFTQLALASWRTMAPRWNSLAKSKR
ncbi:MAG TPA: hypothetical protein VNC50_11000, partial [Planctomycetia bacterium]|nr:hypothetical protein [Planctomycetia bacterium]